MQRFLVDGILLPLRLYFQPSAVKYETRIRSYGAHLNNEAASYNSISLHQHLSRRMLLQSIIALAFWTPALIGIGYILGYNFDWTTVAFGVLFVAVGGMAGVIGNRIAVDLVFMLVFVLSFIAAGLFGEITYSLQASVLAIGVATAIVVRAALAVVRTNTSDFSGSGALVVAAIITIFVASSSAGLVAGVIVFVLTITHLLFYPFEALLNISLNFLSKLFPSFSSLVWKASPVHWDEIIILRLPGLRGLIVNIYKADRTLGREAIAETASHRYQSQVISLVLVQLLQEEAKFVTTLPALAAFRRELEWLRDNSSIQPDVLALLQSMREISQEVDSALESDSATNRSRRLSQAIHILNTIRIQPGPFGTSLTRWSVVLATGLEEAQKQQQARETIAQVYIKDGRPIEPTDRPDTALPFKGRAALFRQLEHDLGGTRSQRTTFVLYGQRRTGKTSTLLQLPRRLGSQFIPVFLDLQSPSLSGSRDASGLFGELARMVVEEAQRHRAIRLPEINKTQLLLDPYPAVGQWLDRVEQSLGDKTLLLCLDEFEALEDAIQSGRFDRRILTTIRNTVQHRQRVTILLAGSHQIDELPAYWANALVTTTTLPISFLDEVDARELIERPVADFPSIYQEESTKHIITLTRCQPYLIQLMCALLVERMNSFHRKPPESYVSVADVDSVVPLVFERGQNYFIDLWKTQAAGDIQRTILDKMAHKESYSLSVNLLREIEQSEKVLIDALRVLLRRELIERVNGGYRITIPLVAQFVRSQRLI